VPDWPEFGKSGAALGHLDSALEQCECACVLALSGRKKKAQVVVTRFAGLVDVIG
jgi:hypothetical protein